MSGMFSHSEEWNVQFSGVGGLNAIEDKPFELAHYTKRYIFRVFSVIYYLLIIIIIVVVVVGVGVVFFY
jgi:hypothetical protein